ncbi:MAG: winged helix-turn-helix domain-containing protein [Actinomycetota bacterium]
MLETSGKARGTFELGALVVDLDSYSARLGTNDLEVSGSQLELLVVLIANKNRVMDRTEIAARLGLRHARTVDVLLSTLRHTIGREFVRNVRSRGWIIDPTAFES